MEILYNRNKVLVIKMKLLIICLIVWGVCALIRMKIFKKLELPSWYSLIPFFGTCMLFKKVWNIHWFVLYMLGIALTAYYFTFGVQEFSANLMYVIGVLLMLIGWTGEKYYLSKKLEYGPVMGLGLALLYPIFLLVIAFKKKEEKSEE